MNKTWHPSEKCLLMQGMDVDDLESEKSDPEDNGQPDNEYLTQKWAGREDKVTVEEQDDEESDTEGTIEEEEEEDWHTCEEDEGEEEEGTAHSSSEFHNSSRLLRKDELLDTFKAAHRGLRCKDGQLTVGLVGRIYLHVR